MDTLIENLRAAVGREAVLTEPDELLVYECDGLPQHKYTPRAVVFPSSTEEVAEALRVLARERVPFAPRGAGTGLSGGALAINRGVVVELARMRRLIKLDVENRRATVETGMVNAQLSRAVAAHGLHYVPDPSSQMTCTIGGNLAENAGGIHCLKYGMTVDHVISARVVLAGGEIVDLGDSASDLNGYDLLGVFIGSEGTFGIATEATLRLVPLPSAVRTLLAEFQRVNDASRAVSAIIAAGLIPSALEMVDGETIRAVEASVFAAGLPTDAEAALLIELDGLEAGIDDEARRAEALCREYGARSVRLAADEKERKRFWAARKGAFGAMGRISPDLMLQDGVVPRSRLPEVLAEIYSIGAKYHLRIANLFHAGDGNLHPVICFDSRFPDEVARVREAGREIMETCVRAGGTITGEHGVGLDKSDYLPLIFSADDMEAMLNVRAAFDPTGLCNPGKIIPTSRSCGEARRVSRRQDVKSLAVGGEHTEAIVTSSNAVGVSSNGLHPAIAPPPQTPKHTPRGFDPEKAHRLFAEIVGAENISVAGSLEVAPGSIEEACEALRVAAHEGWPVVPTGAATWLDAGNPLACEGVYLSVRRMQRIIEHEPADLVATAESGLTLQAFNVELGRAGQWLPLDPPDDGKATLGGVVATGMSGAHAPGYGAPRGAVIGMRVALADGRIIKAGGRVVKNVAGYDLCKLFTGSYGTLCLILELTFKLRPLPAQTKTVVACGPLNSLLSTARATLDARLLPVAVELLSPGVARRLAIPNEENYPALLIRYAGTPATVCYQKEQTFKILGSDSRALRCTTIDEDDVCWRALAALASPVSNQLSWRAQVLPTELLPFLDRAMSDDAAGLSSSSSLWHAGVADGRLRVLDTASEDIESSIASLKELRARAHHSGGKLVIENAPQAFREAFDAWDDFGSKRALMQRVKKALDPNNIFSPGRFFSGM
ncbi:MAG TPA: FAD-linked oxidase C-terminal domain-containing protein [Pyrinomonadaceae bacterium]|nr:FAD-linked oxidase C-terminal domain-containing protein [Pyrinomonadaceae bacterium]